MARILSPSPQSSAASHRITLGSKCAQKSIRPKIAQTEWSYIASRSFISQPPSEKLYSILLVRNGSSEVLLSAAVDHRELSVVPGMGKK